MKERPILFSAPEATDKTSEALVIASHPGTNFAAAAELCRQHQRIEALERVLIGTARALERIALGGESPEDVIDDALIGEVNQLLSTTQQEESPL